MPGDSHPAHSGRSLTKRMASQARESSHKPEVRSRPRSWEASLWGRHIRCHELDQHLYLDGRYLDLTPIEFALFWLLLQQALQVNTGVSHLPPCRDLSSNERISATVPADYLQALGIVPTLALVQAMSADLSSVMHHWPPASESRCSAAQMDEEQAGRPCRISTGFSSPGLFHDSSGTILSRSRASLSSHLDRLRSKLRCHGLDIGTVLLYGRSAQGYLLCPLGDGIVPGGSPR
jgi:hypothetical protein